MTAGIGTATALIERRYRRKVQKQTDFDITPRQELVRAEAAGFR
jgi:hypothetical protein